MLQFFNFYAMLPFHIDVMQYYSIAMETNTLGSLEKIYGFLLRVEK